MTKSLTTLFTVLFACLSANVVWAQSAEHPQVTPDGAYDLETCIVMLIKDIEVPALESGQITKIGVQEGDRVNATDLVAQLDDTIAQRMKEEAALRFESANSRATDSTEVDAADKKVILAKEEYQKNRKLFASGSKSEQEFRRSQYSFEIARFELESARNSKTVAAIDASAEKVKYFSAEDSIKRHEIRSKINGQVFEVYRQAGEWVTAGEKVMRIAQVDHMRVQGYVEGSQYDPHQIANRQVTVTLTMANEREVQFKGHVTFVGLEKRGGRRFSVWAEVENKIENGHWMLQSGSEVRMRIHLNKPPVNSAQNSSTNSVKLSR